MKFECSLLAALFLVATNLLARIAVQGMEPALLATAVEYGMRGIKVVKGVLRFKEDWL
jgi:hypothetical protein